MLQGLVSILSPLNVSKLQEVRYTILQEMHNKKFPYYLGQMNEVQRRVIETLKTNDDKEFMDDDFWTKGTRPLFTEDKSWWAKESPWLAKMYPKAYPATSGTAPITKQMLNENSVNALIGDSPWLTPQQVLFFKSLITEYFTNHKKLWPVNLNIDMSYMMYSKGDLSFGVQKDENRFNVRQKMLVMLKYALSGSGPFMLKIMQQISNSVNEKGGGSEDAVELTSTVFDAVPPLTEKEYRLVLESMNLPSTYIKNSQRKTLGSASLAETHITKDQWSEPMILKMLRPMYAYYFMCECDYLLCVTWKMIGKYGRMGKYDTPNKDILVKQSRQLLLFLIKEYTTEFDYQKEAWFTVLGYKHYNQPSQFVRSAQLIQTSMDPFPAMIQTLAGEESLRSIIDRCVHSEEQSNVMKVAPLLYGSMVNLVNIWLKTVFWTEDAFFHGDLHLGNLMTLGFDKLLNMAENGEKFAPIYVIDYGSSGLLSGRTKCRLLTALMQTGNLHQMHTLIPKQGENVEENSKEIIDAHLVRDIIPFYKDFDSMTASQKKGLYHALNKPNIRKMHAENLKEIKMFVRRIWNLCEVRDRTEEHMESFYKRLLNYSKELQFGGLFLKLAMYGRDIGICTSNPVIMFGRGIAYLIDNLTILENLCNNADKCKTYAVNGLISKQMLTNPKQLVNFLRGKEVCKA